MPIYDTSYRRIEGARAAPRLRALPIAGAGLKLFFRAKRYVLLGVLALLPFGGMLFFLCVPHLIPTFAADAPSQAAELFHLNGTGAYLYLTLEWLFLFLFAALAGGGLVANDLRSNALEVYFSRPITRVDYVLGKLLVVEAILLALTLVPFTLLWLADLLLRETLPPLAERVELLLRLAATAFAVTLPYALLVLAASALARTARGAMLLFAAIVLLGGRIVDVLAVHLDQPLLALLSIDATLKRVAAFLLEADPALLESFGRGVPQRDLPLALPLAAAAAVAGISLVVVLRRVKPVTIVAS